MKTSAYAPRPGTLPDRVIAYFKQNPEEELTRSDVAAKFNVAPTSIDPGLAAAIAAGFIQTTNNNELVRVWVAGPSIGTAKRSRQVGTPPPLPDPSLLVVESGVPMPEARKAGPGPAFNGLFSKLQPSDSFTVPRSTSKRVFDSAQRWGKKNNARFALRVVDETTARIWRTT